MRQKLLFGAQWTALVVLPALATLWMALAPLWGVPPIFVTQVTASVTAVDTFAGTLLGVSDVANRQKITEEIKMEYAERLREELAMRDNNEGDNR